MRSGRSLLLFTKPAVPGRVKTRLQPRLTPEQAAELHTAFLGDLCERLGRGEFELTVAWALQSGEEPPTHLLPLPLPAMQQVGADLGERLFNGLSVAASRANSVAAVGSDHPDLSLSAVERAFAAVEEGADVVFGPVSDGGYYLIGCRADALSRRLFEDIPWSGPEVLRASLQRARELELRIHLLEPGNDVDTPDDLEELAQRLESGRADCSRTAALLAAWGLLSPV